MYPFVSEVTSDEIDPAELREAKSYEEQLSEYVFSASSMEMALECPFKFYVQKMLGLYAETVPEKSYDSWLAPNDFGTLCHEVLSRYYTEPDTDWHNLLSEEVEKMKELQPEGPPSAVAAEIREAERMISRAIDWTNAQGRTVIATEYGFGPKAGTEPLALEINGKTIRLSGSIDRVDRLPDGSISIIDYKTGKQIAGLLSEDRQSLRSTVGQMKTSIESVDNKFTGNTTVAVVITNAAFNKTQLCKIAGMAHDGFARSICPVHTSADGDSIYAVSVGEVEADQDLAGTLAAEAVSEAIIRAVMNAESAYGYPSASETGPAEE